MQLWCLRHAEAESNVARSLGGWPGAPLTSLGRSQAAAAARLLAGQPLCRVYASTSRRATETAAIIAAVHHLDVVSLADLGEVEIGPVRDSSARGTRALATEALRAWVRDRDFGGRFAGGESGYEVVGRMAAALEQITAVHASHSVALVGHVASMTAALSVLCGLGEEVWGRPLPHAVPFVIEYDGGSWRCPEWPA